VALLAVRVLLFLTVAAADESGLARVLFVLVPFTAYFAFGRTVSVALGVACVAFVVAGYQLSAPRWYADLERVSDLLMFGVGIALTIVTAAVAARERTAREQLEASHARLAAYAVQVAELSATAERNRLARDIHDELGHHLTAIALLLEKATAFGTRDPDAARQAVRDAHDSARQALSGVRRSVRTLRTEAPAFRLSAALADLVRGADTGAPSVSLTITGDEDGYDEPSLTTLYRAAQEGITNALRHASATGVRVSVVFDRLRAKLVVTDDGCGFVPEHAHRRFGLAGMRERVQLVDGRLDVESAPGAGTRVVVTVPRRTAP
jgi:signal transduction histidine kinase